VISGDDGTVLEFARRHGVESVVYFGRSEGVQVRLKDYRIDSSLHTLCTFEISGQTELEVSLAMLGEAAALNAAAALAVVLALGADLELASAGLTNVGPLPGRMRALEAKSGARVLDDSYNANPRSMALALDTAKDVAKTLGLQLVEVLGDMKELGARAREEHTAIIRHAISTRPRVLVACGVLMTEAVERLPSRPNRIDLLTASDNDEATTLVESVLHADDVLLVKGSRSVGLERVVQVVTGAEGAS
jgi:UDP-N-acetylmuramoyl-tripeptide--D-alanyl-D-alanine ligase